jgi:GAF domain-containing protein
VPEVDDGVDPTALLLLLDERESLDEALARLVRTCRDAIPACSDASVTLLAADGEKRTAATTSERGRQIDEWEYAADMGPCIDALRDAGEHHVPTLADAKEYDGFAEVLAGVGIRSTVGVPMLVAGEVVGALNVYASEEHAFDDEASRTVARSVASQAATALHNLRVYDASRTLAQQLEQAMASRAVIEQAKGVLMAQAGCTADEAFARLRAASQRENVKLRDVAARVVAGVALD